MVFTPNPLDTSKTVFRVLAFDPAISAMGIIVGDYHVDSREFRIIYTETYYGPKQLKICKEMRKEFKDSFCILSVMKDYLTNTLIPQWHPDYIVTEGAFYHKFVATLISLTLVNNVIRTSARDTIGRDIYVVAPMKTKKSVASKGDAKKDAIKEAITHHPMIKDCREGCEEFPWDGLTEHEFDAVGHGFSFCAMTWMPDLYVTKKTKK